MDDYALPIDRKYTKDTKDKNKAIGFLAIGRRHLGYCLLARLSIFGITVIVMPVAAVTETQLQPLKTAWGHILAETALLGGVKWKDAHGNTNYLRNHIMAYTYPEVNQLDPNTKWRFYGHLTSKAQKSPRFISKQRAVYIDVKTGEKYVLSVDAGGAIDGATPLVAPLTAYRPTDHNGKLVDTTWYFETTKSHSARVWKSSQGGIVSWKDINGHETPSDAALEYNARLPEGAPWDPSLIAYRNTEGETPVTLLRDLPTGKNLRKTMLLFNELARAADKQVASSVSSIKRAARNRLYPRSYEEIETEYRSRIDHLPKTEGAACPPLVALLHHRISLYSIK
jgi:hypothetical protein